MRLTEFFEFVDKGKTTGFSHLVPTYEEEKLRKELLAERKEMVKKKVEEERKKSVEENDGIEEGSCFPNF